MKFLTVLFLALSFTTIGCETREQGMQRREGNKTAGSLEAAAYMAEVETVRRLISEGANVNTTFTDGGTPLFSAVARIPAERNDRRLIARRREVIKLLLEAGANPNVAKNNRPLIETARDGGDPEISRMLDESATARNPA